MLQERTYILGEAKKRFRENAGSLNGDETAKMVRFNVSRRVWLVRRDKTFETMMKLSALSNFLGFCDHTDLPCRLERVRSAWSMQFTTGEKCAAVLQIMAGPDDV